MNNLYLVKVIEWLGYDHYTGAVISALDEQNALLCFMELEEGAEVRNLSVELIGTSIDSYIGVIFGSYHVG